MPGAAAAQGVPNPVRTDVVIPPQSRPVVAGLLGFIPGVGAMYNGQFMKGVIHALTFVVLIFLTTHIGILGILIGFFVFYMVFDAYKTSEAIQHGLPLPDPFGLEAMFGPGVTQTNNWQRPNAPSAPTAPAGGDPTWSASQAPLYTAPAADNSSCNNSVPIGAVILIGLGCLFLLDNMGWFSFSMDRFWPLILIAIGAWLFFKRWNRPVS
jgi:TM2 domain-containing membrane protein YozV